MLAALALAALAAAPVPAGAGEPPAMVETGPAPVPLGWRQFCAAHADECAPAPRTGVVVLDGPRQAELESINLFVNHAIAPDTDADVYGVPEYWTLPSDKGDCEDYALLKRKLLAERGWPLSTLLITIVRDEAGNGHAVLTVRTDRGDLVLDNFTDAIRRWGETPYTFLMRQSARDPNRWAAVSDHRMPAPRAVGGR